MMDGQYNNAINLQKKYEHGELNISNITNDEYKILEKIYALQIYQLNNEIKQHEKNIEDCKKEILKMKKNIKK